MHTDSLFSKITRTSPTIVHVLPQDIARGAQKYADMMRRKLEIGSQQIVTVFEDGDSFVGADIALEVKSGAWRQAGFEPRAYLALRTLLRDLRPNIVIAHGGEALKYCAFAIPAGAKLIYLRIGISHEKATKPVRRRLYSWLLSIPSVIVAVSDSVRNELVDFYGVDPALVRVIPNARDETVFTPEPGGSGKEAPIILFIGHLTATKRPELFAYAVEELSRRGRKLVAKIVGDGPLLEVMKERSSASNMHVLGLREDVPDLLREADVFLFTSRSEGEGMPGVLIEASLAGLPVVTTDVPGARDVVEDGITGFVVAEHEAHLVVESVDSLISDEVLRQEMGANARRRAVANFTFAVTSRMWEDLITELC